MNKKFRTKNQLRSLNYDDEKNVHFKSSSKKEQNKLLGFNNKTN